MENLHSFTTLRIHDCNSNVTGAVLSWDGEFLLTCGEDGILVVHQLGGTFNAVDDIEEKESDGVWQQIEVFPQWQTMPNELFCRYTIQEEKLRKEQDKLQAAAQNKKNAIRKIVTSIQKEYALLVYNNSLLPESARLSDKELDIDPEYREILLAEKEKEIQEVYKQATTSSQASESRRRILQAKYLDILDHEYFVVSALKSGQKVQSFPVRKSSDKVQHMLSDIRGALEDQNNTEANCDGGIVDDADWSDPIIDKNQHVVNDSGASEGDEADRGSGVDQPKLSTFDVRKKLRARRKKEIENKILEKPKEDADDPRDIRAIVDARDNLGCYNLKCSKDYKVPQDQKINSEKKLEQIILMEEALDAMKCDFNKRLVNLRDKKRSLVDEICRGNQKVRDIDTLLGCDELQRSVWEPVQCPSEYPETRNVFTNSDEIAYSKSLNDCNNNFVKVEIPPPEHISVGDKFLPIQDDPIIPLSHSQDEKSRHELYLQRSSPDSHSLFMNDERAIELTPLEKDELKEKCMLLQHKKKSILSEIEKISKNVDDDLYSLRKERFQIATEIKSGEIALMTMSQELELLQGFEDKETMLNTKLAKYQHDKREVLKSIKNCLTLLECKKAEFEKWMNKDREVMEEFTKAVPETSSFHDQLHRIFLRKIKKFGNDDEDDSDFDDDEFDDDDDFDNDDDEDDSCPVGCNFLLYERVLQIRVKRMDQEETLSNFRKELDDLKRAHERHCIRERQFDKDLNATRQDIQSFQREKQHEINKISVIIPLRVDSIYLWEENGHSEEEKGEAKNYLPQIKSHISMEDCVLFSKKEFSRLRERIVELKKEIVQDRQHFKNLKKEKTRLEKEKIMKENDIKQCEDKCKDLQLLKFGQLVDIEKLDEMTFNKKESEIEAHVAKSTQESDKEIASIQNEFYLSRDKLFEETNKNTSILKEIGNLSSRQIFLEKKLSVNNNPNSNDLITEKAEEEECKHLASIANMQDQKLKALKTEINMLRSKRGHIYAPMPQPKKSSHAHTSDQIKMPKQKFGEKK